MRLLIVTRERAGDYRYGLGKSLGRIASGLSARGHDVTYRSQADYAPGHATWQPRLAPWLRVLGEAEPAFKERLVQGAMAAREALTHRASHVWVQDPWLVPGLRLGLWRQRYLGRRPFRLIVSQHGLGSFVQAARLDGLSLNARRLRGLLHLERKVVAGADRVFVPSEPAAQALARDLGWYRLPSHCRVLGYGCPEQHLPDRDAARRQLGVNDTTPLVLAMGRLSPAKRYERVIETLVQLEYRHGVTAQLLIAGDGDSNKLCLRAGAERLSHPPRIETFEDVGPCLAAADAYLSACNVESFGLANREAVAAGLPCVVASGGASDVVLGRGAWLMPAEPETMAGALNTVLGAPVASGFWRQQALTAAAQWPAWETVIDNYEQALLSA